MALTKIGFKAWERRVHQSDVERAKLLGWSPGGAAAELGISRQAVHKAIHRGDLDAVIVNDENGRLRSFMIPDASLRSFAERRAQKAAG